MPSGRPVRVVPQRVEIDEAFSTPRENELPRVAALVHMVRGVRSDDACESSREQKARQSHETGNAPSVPGFFRDNTDWIKLHIEREALTYALGMPAG